MKIIAFASMAQQWSYDIDEIGPRQWRQKLDVFRKCTKIIVVIKEYRIHMDQMSTYRYLLLLCKFKAMNFYKEGI